MRRTISFIVLILTGLSPCFAQNAPNGAETRRDGYKTLRTDIRDFSIVTADSGIESPRIGPTVSPLDTFDPQEMLLLSLSSEDYPVTPGDTYQLTYVTAESAVTALTVVASDYTVNLGVLGTIEANSLTFPNLKKLIEQRIARAYPDSSPSATLVSNGRFSVFVKGEVKSAGYYTAWGLTRLSRVVEPFLTSYSSNRDVLVASKSGQTEAFDLFRANRFGDRDQDPYLRPGDTIIVNKRVRAVRLTGAVKREGVYQLGRGENLQELIEYYGDGFTELADPARVRVQRLVTESDRIAESFLVDLSEGFDPPVMLRNLDSIIVPHRTKQMPVFFLEGAIVTVEGQDTDESDNDQMEEYNKISIPFAEGQTLYSVLKDRPNWIDPNADLENAYLIRDTSRIVIPVDLTALLYIYDSRDDIVLEPYDRLVVPFGLYTVLVTGGVIDPGRYAYLPNKTYRYYIDLAGGVDPEKGSLRGARIMDRDNSRISKDLSLEPDTRIHVPYSFSYYFLKYFPLAVSSATAIYYIVLVAEKL